MRRCYLGLKERGDMASDDENSNQNGAPVAKGTKAPRPKTQHPLPTDRIALKKQFEIVRASGQLGTPGVAVTNEDVAGMVKLNASTTSLANAFLTDVGLFVRTPDGLAPSAEVVAFARAYDWDADTAGEKLAPVFEASWIGTALLRRVRFRQHTKQEALAALADASGASASHRSQLEDVLKFLELAALIVIDGETIKAGKMLGNAAPPPPPPPNEPPNDAPNDPPPTPPSPKSSEQGQTPAGALQAPGVSFNISLSVTMAEIATLPAEKITAFFAGVAAVVGVQAEIDAIRKGTPRSEPK
jgi:hypothetical protein